MRDGRPKTESDNSPIQGGALPPSVGELVRARRAELGLTLARLAALAGCTKGYLSEIENGRRAKAPGVALLTQLESALQLGPGRLVEAAAWHAAPPSLQRKLAAADASAASRSAAAARLALLLAGPTRDGLGDGGSVGGRGGAGRSLDALYRSGALRALAEIADPTPPIRPTTGLSGENIAPAGMGGGEGGQGVHHAGLVPIINAVAAGYPADFTDLGYPARVADDYLPVPDLGEPAAAADPDAFAARVVGDSMEPDYREGDIVVFSPARTVRDGDDCFARLEPRHESTFKRVYFERRGGQSGQGEPGGQDAAMIRLQPLNPKYPARTVLREEVAGLYAAVSVTRLLVKSRGTAP